MKKQKKSIEKGVERAKKLKDLEVAKALEIQDILEKNVPKSDPEKSTPVARSDLPKE
ncbi:MAG: hypothetical protein PWR10_2525 [Halanaerobiales bacterium]|nr:hypothetical protein [Halanaerobiales bacterium]